MKSKWMLAAALALAGCQAGGAQEADVEPVAVPKADAQSLANDGTTFGLSLYKTVAAKADAGDNLFLSPWSVHAALAMAYAGARGSTRGEMQTALSFSLEDDALHRAFQSQTAALVGEHDGNTITVGNAFFADGSYAFRPDYLTILRTSYGAEARNVDFAHDPEGGRKAVNDWVEGKTAGRIKDLFPERTIDNMTRLVLANAIHFLGKWEDEFDARLTKDAKFHPTVGTTTETPFMFKKDDFEHHAGHGFAALRLPYKGGRLAMLVLLPDPEVGIANLEKRIDPAFLADVRTGSRKQEVQVFLPKFEFDSAFSLADALKALGMLEAFTMSADLSGMDGSKDLFIQQVRHKAYVRVDEKGTEAAAATGVAVGLKSMPMQPVVFRADHPFLFLIEDAGTGALLFIGRFATP